MSKGALNELLKATPERFAIMVKNMHEVEKVDVLKFLQKKYDLLENLK